MQKLSHKSKSHTKKIIDQSLSNRRQRITKEHTKTKLINIGREGKEVEEEEG